MSEVTDLEFRYLIESSVDLIGRGFDRVVFEFLVLCLAPNPHNSSFWDFSHTGKIFILRYTNIISPRFKFMES